MRTIETHVTWAYTRVGLYVAVYGISIAGGTTKYSTINMYRYLGTPTATAPRDMIYLSS